MDMSQFMPHGHCILWSPTLLTMHVAADALIALSYFSIPLAIVVFLKKRKIKERVVPLLFTAFILSCGITHLFTIWNWWNTSYWLSGFAKIVCAVISASTAVILWFLMPQALRIPTAGELEKANKDLKDLNENLEKKVLERTGSLAEANAKLAEANAKLKEIGKNKSHFFTSVAHEVKNHLSAITSSSEVLTLSDDAGDRQMMAASIGNNAIALSTIIDDLLNLGQLESGNFRIRKEVFSLRSIVDELKLEFAGKAQRKGLELEVVYKDELPEAIESDPIRVKQVLINLLSNAIKYTPEGKVTLVCELETRPKKKDLIKLTVEDTGSGIDVEEIEGIFTLYSRSDSHSHIEGSGIGLSLSTQIASLLGGSVVLNETSSKGSSFSFIFPCG